MVLEWRVRAKMRVGARVKLGVRVKGAQQGQRARVKVTLKDISGFHPSASSLLKLR